MPNVNGVAAAGAARAARRRALRDSASRPARRAARASRRGSSRGSAESRGRLPTSGRRSSRGVPAQRAAADRAAAGAPQHEQPGVRDVAEMLRAAASPSAVRRADRRRSRRRRATTAHTASGTACAARQRDAESRCRRSSASVERATRRCSRAPTTRASVSLTRRPGAGVEDRRLAFVHAVDLDDRAALVRAARRARAAARCSARRARPRRRRARSGARRYASARLVPPAASASATPRRSAPISRASASGTPFRCELHCGTVGRPAYGSTRSPRGPTSLTRSVRPSSRKTSPSRSAAANSSSSRPIPWPPAPRTGIVDSSGIVPTFSKNALDGSRPRPYTASPSVPMRRTCASSGPDAAAAEVRHAGAQIAFAQDRDTGSARRARASASSIGTRRSGAHSADQPLREDVERRLGDRDLFDRAVADAALRRRRLDDVVAVLRDHDRRSRRRPGRCPARPTRCSVGVIPRAPPTISTRSM